VGAHQVNLECCRSLFRFSLENAAVFSCIHY
jgi:hypothetical protein